MYLSKAAHISRGPKEKVRVAFVINGDGTSWMGGANYIANLLRSIKSSELIEPVVISHRAELPELFSEFSTLEYIRTDLVDPKGRKYFIRKIAARTLNRDILFEKFLEKHKIDVLSHYGHLGARSKIPTICWIPDFQHLHMPEFFSDAERRIRTAMYTRLANACTILLLSSKDAYRHLQSFLPSAAGRARVLNFVSDVAGPSGPRLTKSDLEEAYGVTHPYFFLPNQFWAHKNHTIVIEAIIHARARGRCLKVVSTGSTLDDRNPGHFRDLISRLSDAGCSEDFTVLGLVPYKALVSLMAHSVAVINPSKFEGWSTTVEEAKSMGKTIILSDIPVHLEQNPEHGIFFPPNDAITLEEIMTGCARNFSDSLDAERQSAALQEVEGRFASFGSRYEGFVLEALSRR